VRAPFDVKRADQLSTGQFILDQGFDTDGNAQSFDDRVQGKVSAFELQSAISINFFFVGEIQPVFPIGRSCDRMQQDLPCQVFGSKNHFGQGRRANGKGIDIHEFLHDLTIPHGSIALDLDGKVVVAAGEFSHIE